MATGYCKTILPPIKLYRAEEFLGAAANDIGGRLTYYRNRELSKIMVHSGMRNAYLFNIDNGSIYGILMGELYDGCIPKLFEAVAAWPPKEHTARFVDRCAEYGPRMASDPAPGPQATRDIITDLEKVIDEIEESRKF